jgi:hypothetical protein
MLTVLRKELVGVCLQQTADIHLLLIPASIGPEMFLKIRWVDQEQCFTSTWLCMKMQSSFMH